MSGGVVAWQLGGLRGEGGRDLAVVPHRGHLGRHEAVEALGMDGVLQEGARDENGGGGGGESSPSW